MPFGLKNVPPTYKIVVSRAFKDYLDDIMGPFTIGVPKKEKRILGLLWGYILQIIYNLNKFK
jgi:hypothetical protein